MSKKIDLFIYMKNFNQVKKPGLKPKSLVGYVFDTIMVINCSLTLYKVNHL